MALLKKNGKRIIKNYFDYHKDSDAVLKHKRGIVSQMKLDTPLFSWPKDKVMLLSIINTYLANYHLDKMSDHLDEIEKEQEAKDVDLKDAETPTDENANAEGENNSAEKKEESDEFEPATYDIDYQEEINYIDESEYIELPDQIHDIENCTAKMLGCIIRILNARGRVLKKIKIMKETRLSAEEVSEEIEKVVVYNIVLAK